MPDKEKQLDSCRSEFHTLHKEVERMMRKVEALEAKLYGAHGDLGDVTEIRGWMKAMYGEIGKIQTILQHIKEAMK